MERVQLVDKSANNDSIGEPDVAVRPYVFMEEVAAPCFEVLTCSARSVIEQASGILHFFDGSLPAAYRGRSQVSVSLDAREVFDKSFPEGLLKKVRLRNIEPSRIWLEICEGSVLSETAWQQAIPTLAGCGFRVVVKRFIADNSDFDILASPHIAAIKVDPQVVSELPGSILARQFVRGLHRLSNAIEKQLVIDGVETIGQALWLEAMGCDALQGSYYGAAMDVRTARRFVLEKQQHVSPTFFEPVMA